MTYAEFKNTYKKAVKRYPDITNVWDEKEEKVITMTESRYIKIGSRWKETESKTMLVSYVNYMNVIDPAAVAFFKNLGGYEKVSLSYTKRGYIPTENISISPDRDKKTVRSFKF